MKNFKNNEIAEVYSKNKETFMASIRRKYSGISQAQLDDLYQEVAVAAMTNLRNGKVLENTNWSSYLIKIGENQLNSNLRSVHKRNTVSYDLFGMEEGLRAAEYEVSMSDYDNLNDFYAQPELIAVLEEVISKMPERNRRLIYLCYYKKKSMVEIAEELGYSNDKTAKATKHRVMQSALRDMQTILLQMGFTPEELNRSKGGRKPRCIEARA